ncbi:MAG: DUF3145 family protein [Micrococcales bacterium]
MQGISARGQVTIHSAPRALLAHVEWTISRSIGMPIKLEWQPRRGVTGEFWAEAEWQAETELGASLASDLRGWASIRFEVTQESSDKVEGYRWAYTPALGMFGAGSDRFGNVILNEHELAVILSQAGSNGIELQRLMRNALGYPWDEELENYRNDEWQEPARLKAI